MKKMFLLITSMMFSVALFADNDQTYFFTKEHINEYGIYNMNYSFATDMPVEQAYSILKSWLIGLDVQERSLTIDRKNEELGATIAFNTKVTYNPFAGAFSEFLYVDIQILINDGSVECKFDNFQIMSVYSGYGTNRKTRTIGELLTEIENASLKKDDKSISKKARKEATELYEDNIETLNKASHEYRDRIESTLKSISF